MTGRLTTHVLDTSRGKPAEGMLLQLWRIEEDGVYRKVCETRTNADGRLPSPLLEQDTMVSGMYELVFFAGDYFREASGGMAKPVPFLEAIPVRFVITDIHEHYHVPLLVAPGGYSTYRGS
ncbi:hydroxyisourate hydrolase [Paenibacillus abyssi]|uniref:5-hydroxyisourate hydrolase n=1 Tax=Paenibacillus abyssi TaxID=1340531 RepID=A0A917CW33_9BACL|nr:hydroxyisourate hydrolase [Paenibacillus abyssi]GGF99761.1 5-hydroxyisourate hydrolase [Paenibacillus abyssi]